MATLEGIAIYLYFGPLRNVFSALEALLKQPKNWRRRGSQCLHVIFFLQ